MRLSRWIKIMMLMTVVGLVYIHLQMKIYQLAYQAKTNEKQIQQLKDDNGFTTYRILALKSVSHMGKKFLDEESQLQFVGNKSVYELALSLEKSETPQPSKNVVEKLSSNIQNLLTFTTAQADAQPLLDIRK